MCPYARILTRCRGVVFEKWREQDRFIHQCAVLTACKAHNKTTARGMPSNNDLLILARFGLDKSHKIILHLVDEIHVTPTFRARPMTM